jgi:hypothetical protein
MATSDGMAVGGGALTASLIDLLVEKRIITGADARTIIERARNRLVILETGDRMDAGTFISSLAHQVATRS